MNAPVKTSAFKTGNSVAVRLPKAFGIREGDALELHRNGAGVDIRPAADPERDRALLAEMIRRLEEVGPIDGDPNDGRIEFPDRPGLY